jgi:guanine deaminase
VNDQDLTVVRGTILNPTAPDRIQFINRGDLVYDREGSIIYCGPARRRQDKRKTPALPRDAVIIPGLIDGHTHLSQYYVRGRTGHTLMEWLSDYVFPAEASFRNSGYARKVAAAFYRKLLSNGVTAAAVYSNYVEGAMAAAAVAREMGIRAVVGLTLMDRNVPPRLKQRPEQALEDCRRVLQWIKKYGSGRLWFSANPRFAPACSPRFLEMIGRFARETGCYVQTHLSENEREVALVKKSFPGEGSYTEVYDRFGLLGPRTLLAHCIHLSARERRLIRRRRCAVVHCPSSNLFLHSGRFPVEHWRDYPKMCLGTDVGAGPSFSMLDVMRDAYFVNRQTPEALFHLATGGGAGALGLESDLGGLEPGKRADFSVVTVGERAGISGRALLSDLIFKWDQVKFHRVFVGGMEVFRS